MSNFTLPREIRLGLIGGLIGTIVMDLVMIVTFLILGMPTDTFISVIGQSLGIFLFMIGITLEVGVLMPVALHYLTGLLTGLIFGAIMSKVEALREDARKGVVLVVLVTEVLCIGFFLPLTITLGMTASDMLSFLALTSFFHLVFSLVFVGFIYGNVPSILSKQ